MGKSNKGKFVGGGKKKPTHSGKTTKSKSNKGKFLGGGKKKPTHSGKATGGSGLTRQQKISARAASVRKKVKGDVKKGAVKKGGVKKGGVKKYGTSSKGKVNRGGIIPPKKKNTPKNKPTEKESSSPGSSPRNFNDEGVGARDEKNMRQNQGRAGAGVNVDEGGPRGGKEILARDTQHPGKSTEPKKIKKDVIKNDPYQALKDNAGVFSLNS